MKVFERRMELIKVLYRREYETINNLAFEFGVSNRTIRRDIDELSRLIPIYTKPGRYGGGIYLVKDIKKQQVLHPIPPQAVI